MLRLFTIIFVSLSIFCTKVFAEEDKQVYKYLNLFGEAFESELAVELGRGGTRAKQLQQLLSVVHNRSLRVVFGLDLSFGQLGRHLATVIHFLVDGRDSKPKTSF